MSEQKCNQTVSVVIPVFNREALIGRAVSSVLDQSYSDIECIVVDDCSTDSTREVVEQINDPRLRYYRLEKNRGAAAARNAGVSIAGGGYIAFLDSDDTWRKNKLAQQMKCLAENKCDIVLCRLARHNHPPNEGPILPSSGVASGMLDFCTILKGAIVAPPAALAKRQVFDIALFDETLRFCEDEEWAIRAAKKHSFYLMDEVLGDIYLQRDSVTIRNASLNQVRLETLIERYGDLYEKYPDAYVSILNKLARTKVLSGSCASDEYRKVLSLQFSLKHLVKYLLSRTGFLRLYFNTKE